MREKRDATIRIAARRAILQVTLDRASHLSKLTSYLMMSASHQVHFQQGIVVRMSYHLILQYRLLRVLHLMVVSITLVLLLVSHYPVGQGCLRFPWHVLHDGPIGLVYLTITKHIVESTQCLGSLGKHHKSRNRTIKAMHHAQEHIAWLLVLLLDILFHSLRERLVASLIALHDFATSLRDYDYMVVFVNYLHVYL